MNAIVEGYYSLQRLACGLLKPAEGLGPLALRLYLVPVFWAAGTMKISGMEGTIYWFEHSLEFPFPTLMAYLAAYTEAIGAVLLALGLATRWVCLPLMFTMAVAAWTVHWDHGWAAIADSSAPEIANRLGAARELLQVHGNYDWLTEMGTYVILNNGVEFAVTYFVMLLALFFTGGGRYTSLDYYLGRIFPSAG